jgi:hypothetical protein
VLGLSGVGLRIVILGRCEHRDRVDAEGTSGSGVAQTRLLLVDHLVLYGERDGFTVALNEDGKDVARRPVDVPMPMNAAAELTPEAGSHDKGMLALLGIPDGHAVPHRGD